MRARAETSWEDSERAEELSLLMATLSNLLSRDLLMIRPTRHPYAQLFNEISKRGNDEPKEEEDVQVCSLRSYRQ